MYVHVASSSHMKRVGELGRDLQNFRQSLVRESMVERLIDILQRHTSGEAFEDQRNGQSGATDRQFAPEQLRVGHDPAVVLIAD